MQKDKEICQNIEWLSLSYKIRMIYKFRIFFSFQLFYNIFYLKAKQKKNPHFKHF